MTLEELGAELGRRIHRGIDFAPQPLLRRAEGLDDRRKGHVADDQQIDVAIVAQLPARGRAKDERNDDPVGKRLQRLTHHLDDASRFHQESLKLRKDRRFTIRLKIDLPPFHGPSKQPGADKRCKLSLHGAMRRAGLTHELAKVEGPIGMAEEPAEHAKARLAEEHRARFRFHWMGASGRTHFGSNRTQNRYGRPGGPRSPFTLDSGQPRNPGSRVNDNGGQGDLESLRMSIARSRRLRVVLATALATLTTLCGAVAETAPPSNDAVTDRIREIIRRVGGDSHWGADSAAKEIAERGQPVEATWLTGSGHAWVALSSDGKPIGAHLWLQHVKVEGDLAAASECVLRLGQDEDASCPPAPLAVVDCATWNVPADAARAALLAARAALFSRVYEKKYVPDPREESLDEDWAGGVSGGVDGGTTADFVAVANVVEASEHPMRVSEEWAGYASSREVGHYVRADAATDILNDAFGRPKDAQTSPPPPALHAEFSRLFTTLPLDAQYWWWVRERMVLMAGAVGTPADVLQLKKYLTPKGKDPGGLRTRDYALEALARRTERDTRCDKGHRLKAAAAAAAWLR